MDAFAVAALCREWQARFQRARIDRIHQPSDRDVVLTVRTRDGTARLLLSAHRQYPRAHALARTRLVNPEEPPMFCMRLRKHLEGGRILAVRQQGFDRVLEVWAEHLDDVGDVEHTVLILEIMGKHSNLILCRADTSGRPVQVIDSIVHVTPEMSRVRPVLPGMPYVPPPAQAKTMWNEVSASHLARLNLASLAPKAQARAMCSLVLGLGPVTAAEVIFRASRMDAPVFAPTAAETPAAAETPPAAPPMPPAALAGVPTPENLLAALREVCQAALDGREGPHLGLDELGRPVAAAPHQLWHTASHVPTASLSEALEQLYTEVTTRAASAQAASELIRVVEERIDKLRGKAASLREELAASQQHETWRIKGELLTAFAAQVQKGMRAVELPNYYDEGQPLLVELDPALGAIENAQRYFKEASRHKRAIPALTEQLQQVEADIAYLEGVLVHLRDADASIVAQIRQELEDQGFVRARRNQRVQRNERESDKPDQYISSDGFVIRVGRNNRQNDRLTLRSSQPHDVWLHVKEQPGSHVVIETRRQEVPQRTLEEAALLAAYFSKARDSANVPVDYTLVKHVWKPHGARPGHVLYEHHRTLYVTPDRRLLAPLFDTRRDGRTP